MLDLIEMARGGLVFDPGVARRIGELLLEAHYGTAELERQRPLIVTDKGDQWQIDGSWNRDQKIEGKGPFFMSMRKFDGRVLDFGVWGVIHMDPKVKAMLEAHARQARANRTE
jgi:hypothetical protein